MQKCKTKKILLIMLVMILAVSMTACGSNPELTQFKNEMDSFCTSISEIDSAINGVNPEAEDAVEEIGIIEGVVFNGDDEVTRNDVGIMILNVLNVLK